RAALGRLALPGRADRAALAPAARRRERGRRPLVPLHARVPRRDPDRHAHGRGRNPEWLRLAARLAGRVDVRVSLRLDPWPTALWSGGWVGLPAMRERAGDSPATALRPRPRPRRPLRARRVPAGRPGSAA